MTITLQEWIAIPDTPLGEVIKKFEQQNPDINVELAPQIPFGEEYDTRMQTQLGAGTAPTIFRMNDDFLGSFSQEGVLKDLSEYTEGLDKSQYVEALYDFGTQEDGTYTAWTVGVQPRVIFYNKDMFAEAGVDLPPTEYTDEGWRWEDFLATAEALTVPGQRWGATVYQDTGYEQTWSINNGSETGIFSEDGTEFTLSEPEAAEGLQWVVDMTCEHRVQPPWSELQQDDAEISLFASGRVAMVEAAFSNNAQLQNVVTDFEYDIAPIPGNVAQVNEGSLYLYVIPESTPQAEADAAWKLLEYMGGEEAATIFAEGGFFVPLNRTAAKAIQPEPGVSPQNMALLSEAAEHSISPNFPPENASLARQLYRPQLDAAYNCEQSVQEVLSRVKDQVDNALAQG
ncbi:ABC transporter substrate-binding protein [Pseudonocardia nigra]|uniref:ABC transporter substrate-binding protein n=1 Tax=Pseudonocardia nigra TaxID=1921578 RepID=UPI001C5D93CD|nr:sugar ABC transporter substrate-binding protein [Pseudonocardia nigra]